MELMTDEVRKLLPPLYSQEAEGGDAVVYVRFFTPDSSWTFNGTEGQPEGEDFLFFGLVEGFEKEIERLLAEK